MVCFILTVTNLLWKPWLATCLTLQFWANTMHQKSKRTSSWSKKMGLSAHVTVLSGLLVRKMVSCSLSITPHDPVHLRVVVCLSSKKEMKSQPLNSIHTLLIIANKMLHQLACTCAWKLSTCRMLVFSMRVVCFARTVMDVSANTGVPLCSISFNSLHASAKL